MQLENFISFIIWLVNSSGSYIPLQAIISIEKARVYTQNFDCVDSFQISEGWLRRRKKQYNIPFKTFSGMFPQTVRLYKLSFNSCYC